MKKAYDVVIIGGGITGCALAFELAKRGRKDVLLVEREYLHLWSDRALRRRHPAAMGHGVERHAGPRVGPHVRKP